MERLIDANALIEKLDAIYPADYGPMSSFETHNGAKMALEDARDLVDTAPTVDIVPKWISVEDKLPENRGNYLTVIHCPKGDWIEVNGYCHLEERWEHDCGYYTEDVTGHVTHWMPLPPAPNVNTKGDKSCC